MKFNPYPYQDYCIRKIIETPFVGLFLDCGLGKTVITLSAFRALKYDRFQVKRMLVIAPKKVAEATWTQEAASWGHTSSLRFSRILGTEKKRIAALRLDADIYLTNRENVCWLVRTCGGADWPFDMVVLDESSSFKNPRAKRFKALAKVRPRISRLVELSGTPSPNSLMDLWAQVYLLDGGERLGTRYRGFQYRYFDPIMTNGMGVIYKWRAKPGAKEAVLEKIQDICISMKAEDYLELPEEVMDVIPVELDPKARKQYDQMEKQMVLELAEETEDEEVTAASAAALTNKLLQLSNGAVYDEEGKAHEVHRCKIESLLELIERLNGKSALVFYNFRHDRDRILKALQKTGLRIRELQTELDIYAWNSYQVDILLAHPASAGYGLNLQKGGSHIIWFGLTWNYEQYLQANKRLHRQGQKNNVIIHHLVSTGTEDETVMQALGRKKDVQDYVLDHLKARIREMRRK